MPDPREISYLVNTALKLAAGNNVQDRLYDAWINTRNSRENGACGDANLAIAEHYLYARYQVAKDGYTNFMKTLAFGYSAIKAFGLKGLLPQTGNCQVTPFSRLDYNWSCRGADDGLDDYLVGSKTSNYDLRGPEPPN